MTKTPKSVKSTFWASFPKAVLLLVRVLFEDAQTLSLQSVGVGYIKGGQQDRLQASNRIDPFNHDDSVYELAACT